jgi:virginiamycin A acetyltransferase
MRFSRIVKQAVRRILTELNIIEGKKDIVSLKKVKAGRQNSIWKNKFFIRGHGKAIFGKYSDIGQNVRLITTTHNANLPMIQTKLYWDFFDGNYPDPNKNQKPIVIGNDVWFGDNATILPRVTIGDGAVIGAGSVVVKDVPPYAIVFGAPAKIIQYRFKKEIRDFLVDLKWWDWSDKKIKMNEKFFTSDLNRIGDVEKIKKMIR